MKKRILLTGGSGFIGSNVLRVLNGDKYDILFPKRQELNLKNEQSVVEYLKKNKIDIVLHFANPTPAKNKIDTYETIVSDSLRIFLNFYNHRNLFRKMIYTGSGAEYNKQFDIDYVDEWDSFKSVPYDDYGLLKQVMNALAENSNNIYNFRIFACFGPNDMESKFITHCIRSVILGVPITIRKDCMFDYLYVDDFSKYIEWGIENELRYHSYNVVSGKPCLLSSIAKIVLEEMNSDLEIKILSTEVNNNYTASNKRILEESGISPFYTLREGIKNQIKWETENWTSETKFDGE